MIGHHLKNIFDSVGFTYVLIFSKTDCPKIPRFHRRKILWKRSEIPIFWGVGATNFQKKIGVWWVQNWEIFGILWVPDWHKNIFPGWFHNFSCIFWSILVIIRKSPGPDFDNIFEVPRIIQKVLEYDRGPQLAISE